MSEPVRTVIVDDEPRARRGVQLLLAGEPDFTVVGEAGCGEAAVGLIRKVRPDLVFMDVQMPVLDGIEALARLGRDELPQVVFVTAFDEYALRAFELHAVDYLLKPLDDARFREALDRVRARLRQRRLEASHGRLLAMLEAWVSGEGGAPAREPAGARAVVAEGPVVLRTGGDFIVLRPEDIDWIEADGDYVKFHVGGRSHLQRETMGRLEASLEPGRFQRIHRSTIVALDRVVRVTTTANGEYVVTLRDGTRLRASRTYQERLQAWLGARG